MIINFNYESVSELFNKAEGSSVVEAEITNLSLRQMNGINDTLTRELRGQKSKLHPYLNRVQELCFPYKGTKIAMDVGVDQAGAFQIDSFVPAGSSKVMQKKILVKIFY